MKTATEKLTLKHSEHIVAYGEGNKRRLTGKHETTDISTFSWVGTGFSDDELEAVVTKLKPYFRKNEYPKKAPPSFYQVTNNSKERPDVWIGSPEKSIIVSITSDIRTIKSQVFSAPYCIRFPRIDRVRFDKPWHECLDVLSEFTIGTLMSFSRIILKILPYFGFFPVSSSRSS